MKIGYARVSTADQNLDLQFNALTDYGCTTIYQEKISGKNTDGLELKNLLDQERLFERFYRVNNEIFYG